jgi:hypothetical protein
MATWVSRVAWLGAWWRAQVFRLTLQGACWIVDRAQNTYCRVPVRVQAGAFVKCCDIGHHHLVDDCEYPQECNAVFRTLGLGDKETVGLAHSYDYL